MAPTELNPGIEKLQDHARGIFQAAVEEADPALALERALGGGSIFLLALTVSGIA